MIQSRPLPPSVKFAVATQIAISAGTYLAGKRVLVEFSAPHLAVIRLMSSGVVFGALLFALSGPKLPPRNAWWPMARLGLLVAANQACFLIGLSRSTASHGALLYALTPLVVYLLSVRAKVEAISLVRLAGILIALSGVVLLLVDRGLATTAVPMQGDLLLLGAVFCWSLYTTLGKPLTETLGPVKVTAWSMLSAGVWASLFAPWTIDRHELVGASAVAWGGLAYLVLLTSGSYLLWYYALSRVEASRVVVFSNVQPVATAMASWAVLGEPISWKLVFGGALIVWGVWTTQTHR